jgi:hypothetical protein
MTGWSKKKLLPQEALVSMNIRAEYSRKSYFPKVESDLKVTSLSCHYSEDLLPKVNIEPLQKID